MRFMCAEWSQHGLGAGPSGWSALGRVVARAGDVVQPWLRREPLPVRPLVVVACGLAAGCAAGPCLPGGPTTAVVGCWLAAAGCLVGWWHGSVRGRDRVAAAALCGAVVLCGMAWSKARSDLFAADELAWQLGVEPAPVAVRGTIVAAPRLLPAAQDAGGRAAGPGPSSECVVAVDSVRSGSRWRPASGRAAVVVAGEPADLVAGTRVRVLGRGLRPAAALNPGEADGARRARSDRCLSVVRVDGWDRVRVVSRPAWWSPAAALDSLRSRATATLEAWIAPHRAGLAAALLLGARRAVPRADGDAFVVTGTVHVLTVSGLHVGLVAAGLVVALRCLCVPRRAALAVVAACTGGYMLLTGAEAPVVRATILVWIACGAAAAGRRAATLNSLAAALIVVLAWHPPEVFDAGAQLSFLSTAVLVGASAALRRPRASDPIERLIERSRPRWERTARHAAAWAWSAFVVGAAVWLATAPLVAHRFHVISPVALALNVLIAPLVPVAMGCGFLCLLAAAVSGPVAAICGTGCDLALAAIGGLVAAAARVPWGHAWVAGPAGWWVAGWYVVFGAALLFLRRDLLARVTPWTALACAWAAVGLAVAGMERPGPEGLRIVAAAVGHGCGIVVRSPTGRCLLYDAGRLGAPAAARRSLAAVLWSEGITRIDTLVVSHADVDHHNAVPDLITRFGVGRIVVAEGFPAGESTAAAAVLALARQRGISVEAVAAGDEFVVDDLCRVRVLHPVAGRSWESDNEASLVLSVEAAGRRALFTGDLEGRALREFVDAGPGPCDVLVAPHHGSRTSLPADIAAAVRPTCVLVSGRGGRSWPEVQEAYATAAGRPPGRVLVTAGDGAIAVTLTARGVEAERFSSGRWRPVPAWDDAPAGAPEPVPPGPRRDQAGSGRVGLVSTSPATISTSWLATYPPRSKSTPLVNP